MNGKIDWKRPTTIMVILFILVLAFFFSQESKADTALELTSHATFVAGNKYDSETLFIIEKFNDRKYQVGMILQTRLDCIDNCKRGSSSQNQAVFVQRVTHYHGFKLGVGISYWHAQTPAWNSNTPYALTIGYNFSDNLGINWRHFSTAGSSSSNGGLDMLTFEYNF